MSLYYNTDNYELKEIDDEVVEGWRLSENPKYSYYLLAPEKPVENAVWNNGTWIVPEIPIPPTVSARQVRIWLIQNGISLSQVDSAINSIEDATTREVIRVEWEYAPYIERTHPMLVPLGAALGLSEEQIDQAFIQASTI